MKDLKIGVNHHRGWRILALEDEIGLLLKVENLIGGMRF